ncbi:MAG: glycosyltransferase [Thermoplasmata archaeon]|nr:glycosyltransferase [Thermoplasmata archaeon]
MTGETVVAAIIPVRNGAGVVERAVASVLAQSAHPMEVLLLDDASSDGSPQVLRQLGANDPRVRILTNPVRVGLAATLNRGLRESKGRYVLVLHQDCQLMGRDWVVRAMTALEAGSFASVVGRPVHPPESMGSHEKWFWIIRNHLYAVDRDDVPASDSLFSENKCDLFRRSALEAVGGFDERTHAGGEDQILAVQFADRQLRTGRPRDLPYQLSLGHDTGIGQNLRKDRDYGIQMRRVLRRTKLRALRATEEGPLDPRLTNRAAGVAWILALVVGVALWLFTRSPWFLLILGLAPLLRLLELEARAISVRRAYHLRARDVLAVGGVGLVSDLAYAFGTVSPYRMDRTSEPSADAGRSNGVGP